MHALAAAAAVLVELDGDKGRLGLSVRRGIAPACGSPSFEVIQRAMHEVLAHLLPGALVSG